MSWKGTEERTQISDAALTAIGTVTINAGATDLWADVYNSDAAFSDFDVSVKGHEDGAWHIIANATSDFTTTIQAPIKGVNVNPITLTKASNSLVWMDVKGLYQARFRAKCNVDSDTYAILRWQVR